MRVIYEPRGKAGEYAKYACNLYKGCLHGCKYCYVPSFTYQNRENFSSQSIVRKNILENLEKDCIEGEGKIKENVLLCFTSDPYQPIETDITRQALQLFRKYNIPFTILTKGGTRAIRDFDLYSKQDNFATTLTFISDEKTKQWEPRAALFQDRLEAIKEAKKRGITTWVSLEPVLDVDEVLKIIQATQKYVDLYKIGKANYIKIEIDWKDFVHKAINLCENLNKKYYIKIDLAKYI